MRVSGEITRPTGTRRDPQVPDPTGTDIAGILDTIDLPLVVVGLDCGILRYNRAAGETLGLTPSALGRRACDDPSFRDVADLESMCRRVIADGEPERHDLLKGDRWFLLRIAPYAGSNGKVQGAVLTFTNVTAFRASVGQAIYEREYTKTILNTVIEPLVVLDAGLRVQTANRAFYDLFGVSREQSQGVALRELGDRDWNGSGVWPALQAALTGDGGFRTMELARDFPGLGRRTILVDARRLSRYGDDLLLLGFRDISDRKQAEEQREAMLAHEAALRREAEAAAQAKDRFLAVVSHELRTPLSPVVMTIAAMARHPGLPADLREDVAIIRRNIELETRLIDDLLDLSRVASGKMRFEVQPTSLHAVLRQAVECCPGEASAAAPHVRLDLKADNDMVAGDPARLQQVFRNLVTNAAKFSPEGGEVVVHTASREGKVRVEVRDHGIGIPPEYLPRIFEAFEQADLRRTRQFGGLGLGLAICKEVVDMHAGSICADSAGPGQGATFTVDLPTLDSLERGAAQPAQSSHREEARENLSVLLVEDHPDTRDVLARLLGLANFSVKTAGSVAAGLQLAAAERFDIVVSDLGLPDGTGYEFMKEIRERYGLKGIALSGYGMEEDQKRSREAGFLEHVVKPVDVDQLEAVIRRALGSQVRVIRKDVVTPA